jgi:UDP-N-acetylmuramyl pentapeptide phosphotransferase/UDP-N-acetylglucosamine-1-phosphate transferase
MIEIFFLIISIFFINFFLKKNKFMQNSNGQLHQIYNQDYQVPLSGGIFIMSYFYYNNQYFDFILICYLSFFFILGLFADLNLVKSPIYRFVGQVLLIIFFVLYLDISVVDIRINWINNLLENYYFNIFFVLFCFLVLINGANFIDGNNGISLGYFLIIFILIFNSINKELVFYDETFLSSFLIILTIILIFNLLNKLYIGDSGVYVLAAFSGYILIDIFAQNQNISPYFIVNIFWYPAFEILFSLIRKIRSKYSPLMPDTNHLHQLLFNYYLKKINLNKNYLNSITGLSINVFNGTILFVASLNLTNTKIQIMFLALSLLVYLISYILLLKFKD